MRNSIREHAQRRDVSPGAQYHLRAGQRWHPIIAGRICNCFHILTYLALLSKRKKWFRNHGCDRDGCVVVLRLWRLAALRSMPSADRLAIGSGIHLRTFRRCHCCASGRVNKHQRHEATQFRSRKASPHQTHHTRDRSRVRQPSQPTPTLTTPRPQARRRTHAYNAELESKSQRLFSATHLWVGESYRISFLW